MNFIIFYLLPVLLLNEWFRYLRIWNLKYSVEIDLIKLEFNKINSNTLKNWITLSKNPKVLNKLNFCVLLVLKHIKCDEITFDDSHSSELFEEYVSILCNYSRLRIDGIWLISNKSFIKYYDKKIKPLIKKWIIYTIVNKY